MTIGLQIIATYLPWILSGITIYMTLMAGNKHPNTWLVGIFNQTLWSIWVFGTQNWGFVPLNLALWYVYIRNHIKWSKND